MTVELTPENSEEALRAILDSVKAGHMTAKEAIEFIEANPTSDAGKRIALIDILEVLHDIDRLEQAAGGVINLPRGR